MIQLYKKANPNELTQKELSDLEKEIKNLTDNNWTTSIKNVDTNETLIMDSNNDKKNHFIWWKKSN